MKTAVSEKKTDAACLDELRDLEGSVCDLKSASRALDDLWEHHVFPMQDKKAELDDEEVETLSFMIGDVLRRAEKLQKDFYAAGWPGKGGAS